MVKSSLSETQTRILTNLEAGRNAYFGIPPGRSHSGGWESSYWSLKRKGFLSLTGPRGQAEITDAGRAALALARKGH